LTANNILPVWGVVSQICNSETDFWPDQVDLARAWPGQISAVSEEEKKITRPKELKWLLVVFFCFCFLRKSDGKHPMTWGVSNVTKRANH